MNNWIVHFLALGAFLFVAGTSGIVSAADPRLDQAWETLVKAQALVNAAEDPGAKKRRPFEAHRAKAAELIGKALREVELARKAADHGS